MAEKAREISEKLHKLLAEQPGTAAEVEEEDLMNLCNSVKEIFLSQPMLLDVGAPVKVVGDLHGQFFDLLRLFEHEGKPSAEGANYLFLGDYVDRGKQSIEIVTLLFAYKLQFPDKVHLLRGNHETKKVCRIYGFHDECTRRYSKALWEKFVSVFNCMPVAATIEDTVLCVHAGLSPSLGAPQELNNIERPCDIGEEGLLCDLIWSDPDASVVGWEESDRGVGYLFGKDVVADYLKKHGLELLVRAHQVIEDGYEFFGGRQCVTVFSAPNYAGEFDNAGAVMLIDADMKCSFRLLKPSTKTHGSSITRRESTAKRDSAVNKWQRAFKKVAHANRMFGSINMDDMQDAEKRADRKSYARKSSGGSVFSDFQIVNFAEKLQLTFEVEDLTKRSTTWGDIWEELWYDDTQLADFKYEAFEEMVEDDDPWS